MDYGGFERIWRKEEKGKSIIDKQEHAPHKFPEVSTDVDNSQNRRGTFAVYGTSPSNPSYSPASTPGSHRREPIPMNCFSQHDPARGVCLYRLRPHRSNNASTYSEATAGAVIDEQLYP